MCNTIIASLRLHRYFKRLWVSLHERLNVLITAFILIAAFFFWTNATCVFCLLKKWQSLQLKCLLITRWGIINHLLLFLHWLISHRQEERKYTGRNYADGVFFLLFRGCERKTKRKRQQATKQQSSEGKQLHSDELQVVHHHRETSQAESRFLNIKSWADRLSDWNLILLVVEFYLKRKKCLQMNVWRGGNETRRLEEWR